MDPSRESSYVSTVFHPDLLSEELPTYPYSTFPSLEFIEYVPIYVPGLWEVRSILVATDPKLYVMGNRPHRRDIYNNPSS